ncbi:MAG TPA: hypothetical protein VM370_12510 [Candidatus Thermoplasmatota archaeon]|nr:hypothetical protein [Candidatus Thermoplasmatota archaeon]
MRPTPFLRDITPRSLFVSCLLATALAAPALADGCVPTTTTPQLDVAGALYVADDCEGVDPSPPNDHCITPLGGKWVYQESNGIPGLQRQDDVVDDTCGGAIAGDTVLL